MCWFVTAGVPARKERDLKAALRSSFGLLPTGNRAVLDQLPPGWVAFHVVSGMCSCALYGDPSVPLRDLEADVARFRARHRKPGKRKRGWTDDRIEEEVARLRARQEPLRLEGLRADLAYQLGGLAHFAIVAHEYRGDVDLEDPISERVEVGALAASEMRPDVLYLVRLP